MIINPHLHIIKIQGTMFLPFVFVVEKYQTYPVANLLLNPQTLRHTFRTYGKLLFKGKVEPISCKNVGAESVG